MCYMYIGEERVRFMVERKWMLEDLVVFCIIYFVFLVGEVICFGGGDNGFGF